MYNYGESFRGNGERTDFALSFIPLHQDKDVLDDFIIIYIKDQNGKLNIIKKDISLYKNILTFNYSIPRDNILYVKYNNK